MNNLNHFDFVGSTVYFNYILKNFGGYVILNCNQDEDNLSRLPLKFISNCLNGGQTSEKKCYSVNEQQQIIWTVTRTYE